MRMGSGPITVGRFPRAGQGGGGGNTALQQAAAGLAAGEWVDITANTAQHEHDIQWQLSTIFYDAARKELQYAGKPANPAEYSHYVYSEASDEWAASGRALFSAPGHVWQYAFDPDSGDYYLRIHGANGLQRFVRSSGVGSGSWVATAEKADAPALSSGSGTASPMGWHPNLFGAGVGGVVVHTMFRSYAYNPATDSWSVLNTVAFDSATSPFRNRDNGQMIYLPGADALWCCAQASSANGLDSGWLIHAGAGLSADIVGDSLIEAVATPPVLIAGKGSGTIHGHAIQHPSNLNRLLILEEQGSEQVWDSTDYGATWSSAKAYKHPFVTSATADTPTPMPALNAGEFTIGVIPEYGVIIGMTSNSAGGAMRIWKPDD